MQGLVVIGALVICSLFAMGSAIKCYHCAMVDASVWSSRKVCGDEDKMVTVDCDLLLKETDKLVEIKFGYLPEVFAKYIGLDVSKTVEVNKEDVQFKCAKMYFEDSGNNIGGSTISGNIEATIHTCLPDSIVTPSWKKCEDSDDCYLCDEDECNSSSGIASSLLLSIVLIALTMLRLY